MTAKHKDRPVQLICYVKTVAKIEVCARTREDAEDILNRFFDGEEFKPGDKPRRMSPSGVNFGRAGQVSITTMRRVTPATPP